jgi:superfamily II DNA/RNA helicase
MQTLAFTLPALSAMAASSSATGSRKRSPRMLVLSPTRELAMQSDAVLQEFGEVVGLKSLTVYGGVSKHTQTAALRAGDIDCVVATPGRLKDLINERTCDLRNIEYLILDEADRVGWLLALIERLYSCMFIRYLIPTCTHLFNNLDARHGIRRGRQIYHFELQ